MAIKTAIFNSEVSTPFGLFNIAIETIADEKTARSDLYSLIQSEMKVHIGLIRIRKIWKSNRRITSRMSQIKNTDFAWIERIS